MLAQNHQIQSIHPWEPDDRDLDFETPDPKLDDLAFIELEHYPAHPLQAAPANSDPEDSTAALAANQHLFSARDLLPDTAQPPEEHQDIFPTQLGEPDLLLAGGIARGEMVEIIGRRTSGRFSLVLATLAAATRRGESAALVDLGDHLDPQSAETCGVDLERLLWLRPRHMKEALGCAELLLGAGFALVALDLGMPPVPGGRGAEAAWLRLARGTQTHRGALLVSAPYRMSGTAAQAVLELLPAGHGDWRDNSSWRRRQLVGWLGDGRSPRLLGGYESQLVLQKTRGNRLKKLRSGHQHARVMLRTDPGTVCLPVLELSSERDSSKPESRPAKPSFATPTIERFREQHPDSSSWSTRRRPQPDRSRLSGPSSKLRHAG